MTEPRRCGFAAVIGAPNAGKSTLINRLVGAKVTIVTHKVQTTRSQIRGIAIFDACQIVFVDTPGIFTPRRRLERAMVDAAWSGGADADATIVLIDAARGYDADARRIVERLASLAGAPVLALNKIDTVRRATLLALVDELNRAGDFAATFMISALNGDGVDDLRDYLVARMPAGPWLYPEDQLSDLPQRLLAADVTREKAFLRLHQELPYAIAVDTDEWAAFADGSVRISQTIFVERDSQKGIVLGKGGATIKKIRAQAQADLAEMLGHDVHLFIHVKVRPNWVNDPGRYREWGLRYDV